MNTLLCKTMGDNPIQQVFGACRIGNYIKSRYYSDIESAIDSLKKECTEMAQGRNGNRKMYLYNEQGMVLYKGILKKKELVPDILFNNKSNLQTIMNKLFTNDELAFLATPENEVRELASELQTKSIKFKNLSSAKFNLEMHKISAFVVVKKHNDIKVDINGWELFKKVAKPRDPGKVRYDNLAKRILEIYNLGRERLEGQTPTIGIGNDLNKETFGYMNAQKFVNSLVRMVMVHTDKNEDFKSYLADKNITLTGEMTEFTKGIFDCKEEQDSIKFISKTGREECVNYVNASRDKFKQTLEQIITKLVANAAISNKTRELISTLVDMNSLEEMVYN